MHAGVIAALEDLGVVPTNLSSVSGGSIFASYYVAGGSPKAFADAVGAQKFNLVRHLVAAPNAFRLLEIPGTGVKLLPYGMSRTNVQEQQLDHLFLANRTLSELQAEPDAPNLMICATDLLSGTNVGVTNSWTMLKRTIYSYPGVTPTLEKTGTGAQYAHRPDVIYAHETKDGFPGSVKVSAFVAASGAFPLAFHPLDETISFNPEESERRGKLDLRLADGGVMDNTGLATLTTADEVSYKNESLDWGWMNTPLTWRVDMIIGSDASAILSQEDLSKHSLDVSRAVDLAYARVVPQLIKVDTRETDDTATALIRVLSPQDYLVAFPASSKVIPHDVLWVLTERLKLSITGNALRFLATRAGGKDGMNEIEARTFVAAHVQDLADDLARCLTTFLQTGTLSDRLDETAASELFRLGQYLVYFRSPELLADFHCLNAARKTPGKNSCPVTTWAP
jgi:predicted acylesterase/phospholipase RssA